MSAAMCHDTATAKKMYLADCCPEKALEVRETMERALVEEASPPKKRPQVETSHKKNLKRRPEATVRLRRLTPQRRLGVRLQRLTPHTIRRMVGEKSPQINGGKSQFMYICSTYTCKQNVLVCITANLLLSPQK